MVLPRFSNSHSSQHNHVQRLAIPIRLGNLRRSLDANGVVIRSIFLSKRAEMRSYIKPVKTQAPNADHRAHKGLNNAIEVSHRPTRKREKIMGRFKSHRQAQRFLSAHDHPLIAQAATAGQRINLIFRPRRYQRTATSYRHARNDAFSLWADYTAEMAA